MASFYGSKLPTLADYLAMATRQSPTQAAYQPAPQQPAQTSAPAVPAPTAADDLLTILSGVSYQPQQPPTHGGSFGEPPPPPPPPTTETPVFGERINEQPAVNAGATPNYAGGGQQAAPPSTSANEPQGMGPGLAALIESGAGRYTPTQAGGGGFSIPQGSGLYAPVQIGSAAPLSLPGGGFPGELPNLSGAIQDLIDQNQQRINAGLPPAVDKAISAAQEGQGAPPAGPPPGIQGTEGPHSGIYATATPIDALQAAIEAAKRAAEQGQ